MDATLEQLEGGLVMLFAGKAAERFAPSSAFPGTWSDDDPWLSPSEELAAEVAGEVASDKNPDIRGRSMSASNRLGAAIRSADAHAEQGCEATAPVQRWPQYFLPDAVDDAEIHRARVKLYADAGAALPS